MSITLGLCRTLLLSSFALPAWAAETVPPLPVEQPKPAVVDASHLSEVIQVLYLANASQLASQELVLERNPDDRLQYLAQDFRRNHLWMQETLESKAQRQGISLRFEDLTPTAQQVKLNVDVDFQALSQKTPDEFAAAFLKLTIYQHRKILKLYDQIERINQDADLKTKLLVFRPMITSEILAAEQLQNTVNRALR